MFLKRHLHHEILVSPYLLSLKAEYFLRRNATWEEDSLIANKIHTLYASISYFLGDLLPQTRPYSFESKEYDQNAQCYNYVP